MKSEIIDSNGTKRTLKINLQPEEVTLALEKEFKKVQRDAELKGFRKGKAPIDKIKAIYGSKVSQTVLEELVNTNYISALKEHKLSPVAMPNIDVDDNSDLSEGGFSFTAQVDVRPEVKLKDLSKISVTKDKVDVSDEKIDERVQVQLAAKAEVTPITEDRAAKANDWVKIDFSGSLTETKEPIENGSAKDFLLELGSKSLIKGFEEGIAGMKINETKSLDLAFPEDYFQSNLTGKPVTFEITLKSINTKEFPKLDEAFVTANSSFKTVDEFKKNVKDELQKKEEQRIEQKLNNDLLTKFEELHEIDVPETLVAEQEKSLRDGTTQRLKNQGMPDTEIEKYHEKWAADYKKDALKGVKTSFLVEALASQKELYPKEQDIKTYFEDLSEKTGIDAEKISSYYGSPEKQRELEFKIMEENVIAHLKAEASVK